MGLNVAVFRHWRNFGPAFDFNRHQIDKDTGEVYGISPNDDPHPDRATAADFWIGNSDGVGQLRHHEALAATPTVLQLFDLYGGRVFPVVEFPRLRIELEALSGSSDPRVVKFATGMLEFLAVAEAEENPIVVY